MMIIIIIITIIMTRLTQITVGISSLLPHLLYLEYKYCTII